MKSINFEFLRPDLAPLADLAACAENVLHQDPGSAMTRIRSFAEQSVKTIYRTSRLPQPPMASFYDLLSDPVFTGHVSQSLNHQLNFIRMKGNQTAHGHIGNKNDAEMMLKTAHQVAKYLAVRYLGKNAADLPAFQNVPDPLLSLQALQQQYEMVQAQLAQLQQAPVAAVEPSAAEQQNAQAESEAVAHSLQWNEAQTRALMIDAMLVQAGWDINDPDQVGKEIQLTMADGSKGYADYVLWGDDGQPLAVIEAKKTARSMQTGREQARMYADAFERQGAQRPVIFYTNGYETFIWDDKQYNTYRPVFGFYAKSSLAYLIHQRRYRDQALEHNNPDTEIAGRLYQIEAIKSVAATFANQRRKALIIQATGTGKTRVAIALSKLLLQKGWAKRILFLCDRRELRKQADNAFKEYLGSEPRSVIGEYNTVDQNARIYIATYPGMMNRFMQFDVGFFDLIIADESHRSIYNKYRDLFDYFDALQLGLTATPVKFISRNTFQMFGCESTDPTFAFTFEEAVASGFLVPYRALDLSTEFLREGIHYNDLSPEQQRQLEEDLGEEEAKTTTIAGKDIGRKIFSESTDREILANLIENGIKDDTGSLVGKSIIFAQRQDHAEHLEKVFCQMYPQYGSRVCKVIHTGIAKADMLLEEFKQPDNDFRIAISVDMLDTGIDIPEVVNLVFARPVKSQVKFWQMIGRGTRLRPNLFGPGRHKTQFHIFDHYGNFRYFAESYQEPENLGGKALLQTLFEERLQLFQTALKQNHAAAFNTALALLQADIADLPATSIAVKKHLRSVHQLQQSDLLQQASPATLRLLETDIAPLMAYRVLRDKDAIAFDKLLAQTQQHWLQQSSSLEDSKAAIFQAISQLPVNLHIVQNKQPVIDRIRSADFWQSIDMEKLEYIRQELRGLMQYRNRSTGGGAYATPTTRTEDSSLQEQPAPYILTGSELVLYQSRLKKILHDKLAQSPVLQKVRNGEPVSADEMSRLTSLILADHPDISQDILNQFFGNGADALDHTLRTLVGLNPDYVEQHFERFIHAHGQLSSKQVRFLGLLKKFIADNGGISDVEKLYQAPFTSIDSNGLDGVFQPQDIDLLLEVLQPMMAR